MPNSIPTAPVELVLSRLPDAKKSGNEWKAKCPAHDDRKPSLSISRGDNGGALVYCQAGCSQEAVVGAMGLKMSDLMPSNNGNGYHGKDHHHNGDAAARKKPKPPMCLGTSEQSVALKLASLLGNGSKPVKSWDYGPFAIWRIDLPTPAGEKQRKEFRPVHRAPLGNQGMIAYYLGYPPGLKTRPLYGLSEIEAATDTSMVAILAGEKCADAARMIGLLATCNAGGEKAIEATDWFPLLRFSTVAVFIDNDPAGEQFCATITAKLKTLKPELVVKVIRLPGLPPKGDIVEWIDGHGDTAEPDTIRAELDALVAATPEWQPDGEAPERIEYPLMTCAELMAADVRQGYLIDGIVPESQPVIVAGPKKALKTSLLLCLALSLATAVDFLGQFMVKAAVAVCIMTGESGLATIKESILRMALAMEIDPSQINNLFITESLPQFGSPLHVEAVRAMVAKHNLKAVIVDPAYMCLDGADAGNIFIQGASLRGVSEACRENDCCLILAHHTRKNITQPYGIPELEDIAWAGFQEFARAWILVNRRERYLPGTGCHRLWLSCGGSAGHGSLHGLNVNEGKPPERFWEVAVLPYDELKQSTQDERQKAREEAQQAQLEHDRKIVVQAMVKHPDGETKTTIRDGTGLNGPRFSRSLASLVDEGMAITTTIHKGGRNTPREAYKLAPEGIKT